MIYIHMWQGWIRSELVAVFQCSRTMCYYNARDRKLFFKVNMFDVAKQYYIKLAHIEAWSFVNSKKYKSVAEC